MSAPSHDCPFPVASLVTWSPAAPSIWHDTQTPGPMTVVSYRWQDGIPSRLALRFSPTGFDIVPGWTITVEYDARLTTRYDPPLELLLGRWVRCDIHEKWLTPFDG